MLIWVLWMRMTFLKKLPSPRWTLISIFKTLCTFYLKSLCWFAFWWKRIMIGFRGKQNKQMKLLFFCIAHRVYISCLPVCWWKGDKVCLMAYTTSSEVEVWQREGWSWSVTLVATHQKLNLDLKKSHGLRRGNTCFFYSHILTAIL